MKNQEELSILKEEIETRNNDLCELTEEELELASGGDLSKIARETEEDSHGHSWE